ncbi:hypothetical protein WR25_22391 [Diploscapter pachys]|uniref:beta-ketoacyl-[acyl-carrier-protein] synthase I n=1 Tax=Diploscapter pachys TaxID=2018661 RepID=A0A2A2KQ09_9BILA|nr:hypothetical protein WR25_22391 [Diploscapter pachys]
MSDNFQDRDLRRLRSLLEDVGEEAALGASLPELANYALNALRKYRDMLISLGQIKVNSALAKTQTSAAPSSSGNPVGGGPLQQEQQQEEAHGEQQEQAQDVDDLMDPLTPLEMLHRVVVTGIGVVSLYGAGFDLLMKGLFEGRSALRYSKELGFVVGSIPDSVDFSRWTVVQQREMCRASLLSLLAAEEAMSSADGIEDRSSTLVNIGACMADLEHIGATAEQIKKVEIRKISPYFVPRILNNLPAGYVAMKYKMLGDVEGTSTACATGVHCIGNAFRAVRHGYSRQALAGSAESCVNPISLAGFHRMRALATGDSPFDNKRSGFVLSEGVGLLLMERFEDAQKRGANILAEVLGYDNICF